MENGTDNDMELVMKCRQGDERAFEKLYSRYRLPLFAYIHKILPNQRELVDDIFQQVWMKAIGHWDGYTHQQKLLAWLCRIAHNLVMDYYRRNHMIQTEEVTETIAFSEAPTVYESRDGEAFEKALEEAIKTLSPEQRKVVELRRNGVSYKEIAFQLKTNLNTVLGRMHYALGNLRAILKDYLE